ncbi:mechanosensitive ion channel-like protein [Mucilaginibacter frigoritolerans]|uniref:Mechanosensitive ion channel-like protein n=1 Tax=Mucilaginibacter frigoritolerans TaxID=652788 RepID=A0A562UEW5_9SPHI|nr:mechanosensitive ion channel family protein [Mucilaginibacter frigoritolerans]TWJ04300.1 mechanosensitive ion channel-like protein [Mucilaginibacter frigoritolerans]
MFRYRYLLLFLLITFDFAYGQKTVTEKGAPVIVNQDTVFEFYTGQGLFTAKERASVINKRLNILISQLDFNPDSLVVKNDTSISTITYKSDLILAITNKDAAASELDRPQLAANYLAILKKKLGHSFESNSIKEQIINVLEAIAVVAVLLILIWVINRVFRLLKFRLLKSWETRVAKLAEKGAPVGYADRLLPIVTNLLRAGRVLIIILLVYLALPVAFLIFPWTKPIATQLLSYVIDPLKDIVKAIIRYIPNLLTITVIYLCTRYLIKLIKFIATEIESGSFTIKNFYADWAIPTYNIIRVLLYAFMFVVVFPYLPGSDSKIFQGVTVFLGVLFSFGSSSAISNMIAGLVLTYMRPFKIGDRVKVGEIVGDVIEKNLLITRIRTVKNEDITVPNATILGGATTNYTSSSQNLGLILHTSVTIGYDAPWHIIHQLLINAAMATEGILKDPKPFVYQTDLNDFNVTYQINAYTAHSHQMSSLYSLLHQNIQDKFNEAGMEIMSPHFTSLRDGNAIQIPEAYISKDYKKPGFKVDKEDKN